MAFSQGAKNEFILLCYKKIENQNYTFALAKAKSPGFFAYSKEDFRLLNFFAFGLLRLCFYEAKSLGEAKEQTKVFLPEVKRQSKKISKREAKAREHNNKFLMKIAKLIFLIIILLPDSLL